MLPLLLVWGGWVFRQAGSKFSWKFLGIGSTAVVLGFVANLVVVRLLATPSGVPFANFSYSLYGLASGGKSWIYVFETHPELNALPEPFQSQTIYRMAFELIASNPMLAIKGALYNWSMLFSNSWYSAYSFIGGENQLVQDVAQWVVYLLCILGLVRWSRNRDDSLNGLVVVATIGVLISVPFLPPTDAYRMRPYAASIIVFGLLPAMGLLFAIENLKLRFPGSPNAEPVGRDMLLPYTALLVVVTLIGPSIVKNLGHMPEFKPASCGDGLDSVSIRFDPGTHFNLVRESEPILDWMPNFHIGRFRRNAHSLPDSAMIAWAADLKPTTSLFVTLDYLSMKNVLIVAPTNLLPEPGTLWTACGKWETKPVWEGSNIFTVQTNAHAP
jgi:hypothetical protein